MARKARLTRVLTLKAKFVGTSSVSITVFDETSGETFVHFWNFRDENVVADKGTISEDTLESDAEGD